MLERIPFSNSFPSGFFSISRSIYQSLPFDKLEDEAKTLLLFQEEASRNEIIFYTDHLHIRMVGIFPKIGDEAFFGFWETVDDLLLNKKTFELLFNDARARNKAVVTGPMNFNTFHPYRLRLSNPPWIKFDNEPVNPLYYPTLLKDCGFEIKFSYESRMVKKENVGYAYLVKQDLLDAVKNIPFEFIPMTPENWVLHEEKLYELIHVMFSENPYYNKVSLEQFKLIFNQSFVAKLCPHSSVLLRDKTTGRHAGLSLCQPNFESLKLPAGTAPSYRNDFDKLKNRVFLSKTVGVHPDFRQLNLMNFMAGYAMLSFQEFYDEAIFCLIREGNLSNNFTKNLIYQKVDYALFSITLRK